MQVSFVSHTSVAREPCKCLSRAVQVLLVSRASVSREPCRCCLEGVVEPPDFVLSTGSEADATHLLYICIRHADEIVILYIILGCMLHFLDAALC